MLMQPFRTTSYVERMRFLRWHEVTLPGFSKIEPEGLLEGLPHNKGANTAYGK
jgi:hypothetical protein